MNVWTSVPEHDHPLGGRSSCCYGRAYHHTPLHNQNITCFNGKGKHREDLCISIMFSKVCGGHQSALEGQRGGPRP
ncbi:jg25481 [Pararge aegeria aegeria]|uniref:Jg25481 protein n=1 Tax=Pararge aegeria aegeria TaxID=348720 RepID=A0A8S4R1F5_9NEOP|nr:jg25481 [Pararge aegeria aegeria]